MSQKVLVVDDTLTVRRMQEMLLRDAGYEVCVAEDGAQALRIVERDPPDLVLLDIMMPLVDGVECCRRIKAKEATRRIKVVMVTSKDDREQVRRAFDAGCDGYVTKPVDGDDLLRKVSAMLRIAKARAQLRELVK